jgi:hypothetical protein
VNAAKLRERSETSHFLCLLIVDRYLLVLVPPAADRHQHKPEWVQDPDHFVTSLWGDLEILGDEAV